ncbi:hypothetical protein BDV06DRAFT_228174 [Aspergillus oleicola]
MAAYALEAGGKAEVTAVFRSSHEAVLKNGIEIDSLQHGRDIKGWRPTSETESWTWSKKTSHPLTTPSFNKNTPDVPPTVADLMAPAVTPGKTAIVLS